MDIGFNQFCDQFLYKNRENNFSYEGKRVLFDYLEDTYDGEYDLDVVELCCAYSEDSIENVLENNYFSSIEELERNALVLHVDSETIIYECY